MNTNCVILLKTLMFRQFRIMSRILSLLKEKKLFKWLVYVFVVLLPLSIIFTGWLTDWSISERWSGGSTSTYERETPVLSSEDIEQLEHLNSQLENIKCPARNGLELRDYWKCLWRTTITAEGLQDHQRIMMENYMEKHTVEARATVKRMKNGTTKPRTRGKRQAPPPQKPPPWIFYKVFTVIYDTIDADQDSDTNVKSCQQLILPGISIAEFIKCVLNKAPVGVSRHPTFQPTFYPFIKSEYNEREYSTLVLTHVNTSGSFDYNFTVEFQPLRNEEKLNSFHGADPYIDDQKTPFRYRFSNLDSKQGNTAWSYGGLFRPSKWHELELEKFYIPLKDLSKNRDLELLPDMVQTYPGTGEIGDALQSLATPMDYRWTKDIGYTAYTRYLIPFLSRQDLSYYKSKGLVNPSVIVKPNANSIDRIIQGLEDFLNKSVDQIGAFQLRPDFIFTLKQNYTKNEDVPFFKAYQDFVSHFFDIDIQKYSKAKTEIFNFTNLFEEYEMARLYIRWYADTVVAQEKCVRAMVEKYDYRRDEEDIGELIGLAEKNQNCSHIDNTNAAVHGFPNKTYFIPQDKLKQLYQLYFDREEERQQYSLPKYPVPFPICSHQEPSPIDIITTKARQTNIRDYGFGAAAYRLYRFFMFFPIDGSTLLSVGIVDSERLGDSGVSLFGGAVKGQNLTFQYMHIHFSHSWKDIGSEHKIDGKGAPMELQMVFTISASADPIKYWHILARVQNRLFQFREKLVIVIAVLVDVLESDEAVKKKIEDENLGQDPYLFEPFAQAAYHFRTVPERNRNYTEQPRGYTSKAPVFRFIDFIPRITSKFYTYRGSLSWPPCFGYVIWSVYEKRLLMSKRQFDQFVKIPARGINDNNYANDNFRPTSDIWVKDENDPELTHEEIQAMKRKRTVDRYLLVGTHDVSKDGMEVEQGVVGEEVYYMNDDPNESTSLRSCSAMYLATLTIQIMLNIFVT